MRLRECAFILALVSCAGRAPLEPLPQAPSPLGAPRSVLAPLPVAAGESSPPLADSAAAGSPLEGAGALPDVSLGDVGPTGPVQLIAASTSGAWVALCQGGPPTGRLVLGSGEGEPVDDLLARDPTGRFVVATQGNVTWLLDAIGGARLDLSELGADLRRLRGDYAEHRSLSFDASGKYLAYAKVHERRPEIIVRTLESGAERAFALGSGDVQRLRLSADARYVTYEALREDTNGNGKLDWSIPEDSRHSNACEQPALPRFRSFAYQGRGDVVTRGVVTLEAGAVRDVPDLVTPLGSSLLVREVDGALRLDQGGKRSPLVPASCAGRVLFADAERGLVLISCAPPPPKKPRGRAAPVVSGKREVWLYGLGFARNLQSELYETTTDREAVVGTRLVPLYPGSGSALVDLERRELLPLPSGSRVLATHDSHALLWRESDIIRYDAATKTEEKLAHGVLKTPDLLQAGDSLLLSPFVIVGLSGPPRLGPPQPLALSSGGFVLTGSSDGDAAARRGAIQGPLRWVDTSAAQVR